ncbi:DUF6273 domain-containing protein [Geosporobacter ferrireducens]|uniref:DUF6273 domain-containing protein n=1 Tax=Geosporobacter ferrireducens TaxID=1424294 RepID=UPI00139B740A|nr:DUF6273 domain-containing protein [Geosporobacter ferrireducens]MTI58163.1 hypothetical protein [Geosporobacter ferrireducens]
MKRKSYLILIFFSILLIVMTSCSTIKNEKIIPKDLKVGDYIQFGKYNEVPILWRIIHIDKSGNPLLFCDLIISLKAFDSGGNYHSDKNRIKTGSNYWKDSNIRQWLNSDEEAGTIKWLQNIPSEENMFEGYGPYEEEKGFLADGNFSKAERDAINPITHKSILHRLDISKKDGGLENFQLNSRIEEIVENYDNANYENVEDKVFFLSVKELYEYVWTNRNTLGEKYYIGKVSKEVSIGDEYSNYDGNWFYWLRTPVISSEPDIIDSSFVRNVGKDGTVFSQIASFGGYGGVRPALELKKSSLNIKSGLGIESDPYILK